MIALPTILKNDGKREIYESYIATAVGALAGMKTSYIDMIDFNKKVDNRTGEEVLNDTIAGAGLVVIDD